MSLDSIANSQLQVTKLPAIANSTIGNSKLTPQQADAIIASVADLITNSLYKPYFFKRLYRLGPEGFLACADRARTGKNPARLFAFLIKG